MRRQAPRRSARLSRVRLELAAAGSGRFSRSAYDDHYYYYYHYYY